MLIGGSPDRIELKAETPEEHEAVRRILAGDVTIYHGDSETFPRGALILNTARMTPEQEKMYDDAQPVG